MDEKIDKLRSAIESCVKEHGFMLYDFQAQIETQIPRPMTEMQAHFARPEPPHLRVELDLRGVYTTERPNPLGGRG